MKNFFNVSVLLAILGFVGAHFIETLLANHDLLIQDRAVFKELHDTDIAVIARVDKLEERIRMLEAQVRGR